MTELVIFDFDGTLVESETLAADIHSHQLKGLGFEITPAEVIHHFTGVTPDLMREKLEGEFGISVPGDFFDVFEEQFAKRAAGELQTTTGARETLAAMTTPYCLASNSTHSWITSGLKATALDHHFKDNVFPSSLVSKGKPAPDIFLHILERHDLSPDHCLIVEDSTSGVKAAVAAGCRVIGFVGGSHCTPAHKEALSSLGAELLISDMRDLLSHLKA